MSELDDVKVGDWLAFVNTGKVSDPVLQQVTTVTNGLVKTQNYTFRNQVTPFDDYRLMMSPSKTCPKQHTSHRQEN